MCICVYVCWRRESKERERGKDEEMNPYGVVDLIFKPHYREDCPVPTLVQLYTLSNLLNLYQVYPSATSANHRSSVQNGPHPANLGSPCRLFGLLNCAGKGVVPI